MHPIFAAKSCDPDGDYVRRWIPELALLPVEYIHCPWEAPFAMRAAARVVLGRNYPSRILVDLEAARRDSHSAVMAVRRGLTADNILPSGHEWCELCSSARQFSNDDLWLAERWLVAPSITRFRSHQ